MSHLREQGISAQQGAVMITLYATGQTAVEILLSIIADKLPFHKIYIIAIASLLGGIATIPIMFSSSAFLLQATSTGMSITFNWFGNVYNGSGKFPKRHHFIG